ncbi:MAG: hypothetical protein AAF568_08650 [Pseudomonadota bacterium]
MRVELNRWILRAPSLFAIVALAIQALAGPLLAVAATASDDRALTAICIDGKIQYVLLDLSGELAPEMVDGPDPGPGEPLVILEIDCPLLAGAHGLPVAQIWLAPPIIENQALPASATPLIIGAAHKRLPPVRAPPSPV